MEVAYTQKALIHLKYWKQSGNKIIQQKISQLIEAISQQPYEGVGKPEALKYNLTGFWSRRINQEHRIVYEVLENMIIVHSLKAHY